MDTNIGKKSELSLLEKIINSMTLLTKCISRSMNSINWLRILVIPNSRETTEQGNKKYSQWYGLCFDLKANTPSEISAPMQNLLERLPAIASINGNFNKSFSVPFRAWPIFTESSWTSTRHSYLRIYFLGISWQPILVWYLYMLKIRYIYITKGHCSSLLLFISS